MLHLTKNKFNPDGYWRCATDSMLFVPLPEDFALFDQNGFDLCPLEKRFANANKSTFFSHREHRHAVKSPWFEQKTRIEGAVLNHSYLFERKGYADQAREQILKWSEQMPLCHKLLQIRPKWGLDFSIDWVDRAGNAFEVLHWEYDGFDFAEVDAVRESMEQKLKTIDWQRAGQDILKHKDQWHHLEFFAQSDWKCNYFGIPRERFKMVAWA
jgi:hypothetical protein